MNVNEYKILNNGVSIPRLGLGVFKSAENTYDAVRFALDAGYRHIDTAMIYYNEQDVGRAIKDSGIFREQIFITTKLWTEDMRSNSVRKALMNSLRLLNTDYVDLYLIHWPIKEGNTSAYRVMEELRAEGFTRAIGTSNFLKHHLDELIKDVSAPQINQIEIHPYLSNNNEIAYNKSINIATESWSPLARGKVINDKTLVELSEKYNKTVAQIVIKWHLMKDLIVIPKSVTRDRIIENFDVFNFELSLEDYNLIEVLNQDMRIGSHPDMYRF